MGDVLNPPDKNKLADSRKLMRPGQSGSDKPSGSKLGGLTESMQPQQAPSSKPLPLQTSQGASDVPISDEQPVASEAPQQQSPDIPLDLIPQYSPTETPLPDYAGVDVLQEATSQYSKVKNQVEQQQLNYTPENITKLFQTIKPKHINFAGGYEVDISKVRQAQDDLVQQNKFRVDQNRIGINNNKFNNPGEREFTVSAIDNALVAAGFGSQIGKDAQSQGGKNQTHDNILNFAEGAGKFIWNALQWGYNASTEALAYYDPTRLLPGLREAGDDRIQSARKAKDKNFEDLISLPGSWGLENVQPTSLQPKEEYGGKVVQNVWTGAYGDYGDHPLLSPALYLLNVPQQLLMGTIYDAADLISGRQGKERLRSIDALVEGRDWGLSNRWSNEKYLSLQEPEGYKSGVLAQDDPNYKNNPLAQYWDFPEWFETTVIGKLTPGDAKANHIVTQTIPAMLGEFITGGIADWGSASLVRGVQNVIKRKGTQAVVEQLPDLARITPDVVPNDASKYITERVVKIESEYDSILKKEPIQVEIKTKPITPETVVTVSNTDSILKQTELPSGKRITTRITETPKEVLSNNNLSPVLRSNEELSLLARNTVDPDTGKPFLTSDRVLSDLEIAELNKKYGNIFDRYGDNVPDITNGGLLDVDGKLLEIKPRDLTDDLENVVGNPSSLSKLQDDLDDISSAFQRAVETGSDEIDVLAKKLQTVYNKYIKKLGNESTETMYMTEMRNLPETLVTQSDEGMFIGTDVIKAERTLEAQRPVIEQITNELNTITNKLDDTVKELDALPKQYQRGSIFEEMVTRENYTDEIIPELGIKEYQPKMIIPWEQLPSRAEGISTVLDNHRLWLHGSASEVGIREVDILSGGTPSEFGLGVYLSRNQDVADQAASAMPQMNRPPRPDVDDGVPYRITVDTSKLTKPLLLDKFPDGKVMDVFEAAYKSAVGNNDLPKSKIIYEQIPTSEVWDLAEEVYFQRTGSKMPELQKRNFQQKVLLGLQNLDYDSGLFNGKYEQTLVVYQPHKLSPVGEIVPIETPSITKQLEARKWLDDNSFRNSPTDQGQVRALQSQVEFESKVKQNLSEILAEELDKQGKTFETLIKSQDDLEQTVYKETQDRISDLENNVIKSVEDTPYIMKEEFTPMDEYAQQRRRNLQREVADNPCL